jgi:hypothetical protein
VGHGASGREVFGGGRGVREIDDVTRTTQGTGHTRGGKALGASPYRNRTYVEHRLDYDIGPRGVDDAVAGRVRVDVRRVPTLGGRTRGEHRRDVAPALLLLLAREA